MPYQPVRHFMRHHIDQKGPPIFAIQHGVETQSTPAIVRLAGTLATQITPHLGTWQFRMIVTAQLPGGFHPIKQGSMQSGIVEARKPAGTRIGKRGLFHGVLE